MLAAGERVKVLQREGDWTKVQRSEQTPPPREGWVNTGLLRMMDTPAANDAAPDGAAAETEHYLLQVITPVLWAHRGPDTARPVVARVEEGAQFARAARSSSRITPAYRSEAEGEGACPSRKRDLAYGSTSALISMPEVVSTRAMTSRPVGRIM